MASIEFFRGHLWQFLRVQTQEGSHSNTTDSEKLLRPSKSLNAKGSHHHVIDISGYYD
jgi:hypothetical protein